MKVSVISVLGSSGVGLVWGWLGGRLDQRRRWKFRNLVAAGLATLAIAAQLYWTLDWLALPSFLASALLMFSIHVWWRRELRSRLDQ
jgi:hypothetical protein